MASTMTIAQKYAATIAILKGEAVEGFDTEMAIEFIEDRAAKAVRKPGKSVRKPKPETVETRAEVAAAVAEMDGEFRNKDIAEMVGKSAQAVAAALRFLKAEGIVAEVETEGKGPKVYTFIG